MNDEKQNDTTPVRAPLLKKQLLVGRRESCDIVLRFANVSAHHCQIFVNGGYWYVRDLQSRNGVKVNNIHAQEKRIDPGDTLSVAKHNYDLQYSPADLGAVGPPPAADLPAEIMTESLLSRAGLKSSAPGAKPRFGPWPPAGHHCKLTSTSTSPFPTCSPVIAFPMIAPWAWS